MSRLMVLMTKKQFVLVRSVPIRLRQMSPASVLASTRVAAAACLTQKISTIKSKIIGQQAWTDLISDCVYYTAGFTQYSNQMNFSNHLLCMQRINLQNFIEKYEFFLPWLPITMLIYYLDTKTCSLRMPIFQWYCGIFFLQYFLLVQHLPRICGQNEDKIVPSPTNSPAPKDHFKFWANAGRFIEMKMSRTSYWGGPSSSKYS